MTTAAAAAAAETDARPGGLSHPEAEMVAAAGGSDGTPVKLCVTNVYNSSSSEVVSLETTNTIGDLKRLLQEAFSSRPAPHQQRLIFRGKQCEESQQLGHVLRGLDLSGQHSMHLIVSPSVEQKPVGDSSTAVERKPVAPPLPQQRPPQPQPPQPQAAEVPSSGESSRSTGVAAAASAGAAVSSGQPERIQLSQMQLGQLQLQYQQALRENEQALEEHRQRFNFLSAQSRALTQHQHYQQQTPGTGSRHVPQQQQQQQQQHNAQEAAARVATRALGGNMPGPAGGGGVRDITGPPPAGLIPAAGLGEDGEAGRGNLVDPAPRDPDIGREARGWFKMVLQCMGVIIVFGIDADGWVLALLALGGLLAFLFRTGLLKEMLGSGREGGGLWKKLCTGATVITEGDGVLMDVRFFWSAFFFSLFPKWQPVRSPEAIAAEAAAQAQAAAAQAQAAAAAQAQAAAERAALTAQAEQAVATATAQVSNATPAEQGAELAPGGVTNAMPVVRGTETAASRAANATSAEQRRAGEDPATLD